MFPRGSALYQTRRVLVQIFRAWCRVDQADILSARFRVSGPSTSGVDGRSAGATGSATSTPSFAEANTDEGGVAGVAVEHGGGSEESGVDGGSAGASAGKSRPPSLLLQTSIDEIKAVRDSLSLWGEGTVLTNTRGPSRPIFDNATDLLDVCKVRYY